MMADESHRTELISMHILDFLSIHLEEIKFVSYFGVVVNLLWEGHGVTE
jgi:hypothetical protein